MRLLSASLLLLAALPLCAQTTPTPTSGATLTGSVYCADNNTPARFARVLLKPAVIDLDALQKFRQWEAQNEQRSQQQAQQARKSGTPPPSIPTLTPQQQQEQLTTFKQNTNRNSEQQNSTTVGLDGRYSLPGIPPGTYFVHVEMPGYVDLLDAFTFEDITSTDPDMRALIAKSVPFITVTGTEQQRIDLRIERGAAIAGRILYDDGAPAIGWVVTTVPKRDLPQNKPGALASSVTDWDYRGGVPGFGIDAGPARTDDLGNFRITGLVAGDYVVRAQLQALAPGSRGLNFLGEVSFNVFTGDVLHVADAKPFSIASGQVRSGSDITVPLRILHSIHGRVVAQSDGRDVKGGDIQLTAKDDPAFTRFSFLSVDGTFQIYTVPSGTYTLRVFNASDIHTEPNLIKPLGGYTGPVHHYGNASTTVTVTVTDVDNITLTVPEVNPRNRNGDSSDDSGGSTK